MNEPTDNLMVKVERAFTPLNADSAAEAYAECDNLLQLLGQWVRERKGQLEQIMLEHIAEHGDIVLGPVRYYAGKEKKTTCRDVKATLTALLDIAAGDMDAVTACLSSGAWKPGAIRALLEEREQGQKFADLFDVVEVVDLKTGKPNKKLQKADERFIR